MSVRIGELLKLDGPRPMLVALRGIIGVVRDPDASDNDPTEVVLEGGKSFYVSRLAGEFVQREWEFWALDAMSERPR